MDKAGKEGYVRRQTYLEAFEELQVSAKAFRFEFFKSIGLIKLVDWLSNKINTVNKS